MITKGTYILVTIAYWTFMLSDGALRMLVLLHFHELGYSPIQIAFLFLLYEFAGIVTNLIGGWIGSRYGLKSTLFVGLTLQIIALCALTLVNPSWTPYLTVCFVMGLQALSGVAKDLTKMSSKSAVKLVIPSSAENNPQLFKWVAILTGSKNSLKGFGFFLGSLLLYCIGFNYSLYVLAALLFVVLLISLFTVRGNFGKSKKDLRFSQIFSKSKAINRLSFARAFLFASRDIWFVVGLPIFLKDVLQWDFWQVGTMMAMWVIVYGMIQIYTPKIIQNNKLESETSTIEYSVKSAKFWAFLLSGFTAFLAISLNLNYHLPIVLIGGLFVFGFIFAVNSSLHSYLILAYTSADSVSRDVGFYYMANACGRLVGTLLSGIVYLIAGLTACLVVASLMALIAAISTMKLPKKTHLL